MAGTIIQLLPAPEGLVLRYKDGTTEPAVCLAVLERGTSRSIVPVEASDGDLLIATDNPGFVGAFWRQPAEPVEPVRVDPEWLKLK